MINSRIAVVMTTGILVSLCAGAMPAYAERGTDQATTRAEAWYNTADACDEQVDCSLLPPPNAYPEDTLHVGLTGGDTTAETYLELDTSSIPPDSSITGGQLTLPVDTEPRDGSLRPDQAELMACVVTEFVDSSAGTFEQPPEYNCDKATSVAQFAAEPAPTYTVDLTPFAAAWADGASPRLAILPTPTAKKAGDTWRVVFWGRNNDSDDAKPITASLTYRSGTDHGTPHAEAEPEPFTLADPLPPPPASLPALPEPADAVAPEPAASPQVSPPKPPPPQTAPAPAAATPAFRTVGYQYPIAWVMPIALLGGFLMTGNALTKKLPPPT